MNRLLLLIVIAMQTSCASFLIRAGEQADRAYEIVVQGFNSYEAAAKVRLSQCEEVPVALYKECVGPYSAKEYERRLDELKVFEVERRLFLRKLADPNSTVADISCEYEAMVFTGWNLLRMIPGASDLSEKMYQLLGLMEQAGSPC